MKKMQQKEIVQFFEMPFESLSIKRIFSEKDSALAQQKNITMSHI